MSFLFVDRILHLIPGQVVRGIKHVTRDDTYLVNDDRGNFCFAPAFIGEALGQLAAWNVMQTNDFRYRPVAGIVSSVCLHRPVFLGETIVLESTIDNLDDKAVLYHSVAYVDTHPVFTIDGAMGPLLPMEDFISRDEVQRQLAEILRPAATFAPPERADYDAEILSFPPRYQVPMSFDRVIFSEPGLSLQAEKRISRSAPYFPDHFPYNPVLPMTVLLECKSRLAHEFLRRAAWSGYQIKELRKIKMNDFVYPGDVLVTQLTVLKHEGSELVLRFRTEVAGKRVCVLEMMLEKTDGCLS